MSNPLRLTVIAGFVLAALVGSFATLRAQTKPPAANPSRSIPAPEPDKDQSMRARLGVLLSEVDLMVGSPLPALDSNTYHELQIHWEAGKTNSSELIKSELAVAGALSRVSAASKTGQLPRERSMELSPDRLLVVALDETETVRWWKLMNDPRLVRAELGATSEMHSEKYYLPKVDFTVEVPDDPLLREVRFFKPVWNGEEFRLELLGIAPLN